MIKLDELNMQALVSIHNAIADKPVTMKTFSQRSKAIERINRVAKEKGIKLSDLFEEDGRPKPKKTEPEATVEPVAASKGIDSFVGQLSGEKPALAPVAEQKRPATRREKSTEKKEKGPVIRVIAEALLLEVVTHDEDKRPYGHPYDVILDKIHEQFPEGKTSVACLRWYAVHMRERGERVPNRPRAKPTTAPATTSEA